MYEKKVWNYLNFEFLMLLIFCVRGNMCANLFVFGVFYVCNHRVRNNLFIIFVVGKVVVGKIQPKKSTVLRWEFLFLYCAASYSRHSSLNKETSLSPTHFCLLCSLETVWEPCMYFYYQWIYSLHVLFDSDIWLPEKMKVTLCCLTNAWMLW